MATSFVNSGAAGANNGTSWTDAWTSIASSNGVAAGDVVKVHKTHSETTLAANINWSNGTLANPVRIVCVDKDASDALATGAVIGFNTTNLGLVGNIYVRGCTIQSSAASLRVVPAGNGQQEYDTCTIKNTSTGGLAYGDTTNARYKLIFRNTNVDFSGASNASVAFSFANVTGLGLFEWLGGTYTCRGTQTNLFSLGTVPTFARIAGVNFSGTVTNLFSSTANSIALFQFEKCLAPTFTNVFSTAPTGFDCRMNLNGLLGGTLSAALLSPVNQADVTGTVKATTARYRTGGADDGSQANAHSWEMAGNASVGAFTTPLASPPITRWVSSGSQTITVYVASGGTLNDDECYMAVESPSEAGTPTPQGTIYNTRTAALGTPAALTTDGTSTWNGSGVGTKQKMSVTIAPTVAGPVSVRVHLAKNVTAYVDPKLEVA